MKESTNHLAKYNVFPDFSSFLLSLGTRQIRYIAVDGR